MVFRINDNEYDIGRVICRKDRISRTGEVVQRTALSMDFDPSFIENGLGIYKRLPPGELADTLKGKGYKLEDLFDAQIEVYFSSEREAGVSIPGGQCSSVKLKVPSFELKKETSSGGKAKYTATGRGRFYCEGWL